MFILIQVVIQFAFAGGYLVYYKMPLANLRNLFMSNITLTIASTIVSSLITIFVFLKKGWASHSRDYLASRPWATLLWVVVAAIGIIIPSMGLGELFKVDMPGELQMMFVRMMHNPFGYVAIGVIVPLLKKSCSVEPFCAGFSVFSMANLGQLSLFRQSFSASFMVILPSS